MGLLLEASIRWRLFRLLSMRSATLTSRAVDNSLPALTVAETSRYFSHGKKPSASVCGGYSPAKIFHSCLAVTSPSNLLTCH